MSSEADEEITTPDHDKKYLQKNVQKLQRNIGLKDNNPLILCLIDGDGNIFSNDLISLGQVGGHQAASLLTKGLTDHVSDVDSSGRGQVWLTVYCNKTGLVETLVGNGLCTTEQFEAFVTGFNQASPLFTFVDVGSGKERADEKIKECLRVFTRFPQITKVFFGGAHDNGYISTLNHLQNEGNLQKIIILRGYKELAHELRNLSLPTVEIEGLFLKKRVQTVATYHKSSTISKLLTSKKTHPTVQAQDFEKFRVKSTASSSSTSISTPRETRPPRNNLNKDDEIRQIDPDVPLQRHKPPPCNFFYLADCKHGSKCRYGHNYHLLPHHIEELRESSVKWPCPYVNRGAPCPYGDSCCMGHACPKGRKCSFMKLGKCKFTGPHTHDRGSSGKSHGSTSRSSASSPPDFSPAGTSYRLPSTSPVGSLSSLKGGPGYSFSMGEDGRPVFTAVCGESNSEAVHRHSLAVESHPADDNDSDEY
ncbi:hypothetical protein EUX98_g70 [Antrodiella citrinella]|uniref:C3H1-type domain-containing protein n=1 Tax=Antrodiella citrinella TaxID=2447956 RepID=A0A4S4N763_9APHY|nr:hypothetical protein EUX98_g70 [Antrodiella citrinella]